MIEGIKKNSRLSRLSSTSMIFHESKELLYVNQKIVLLEEEILYLLKDLVEFKRFISFNNIDDDSLKTAIRNGKYLFVPKDQNVFQHYQKSSFFFCILNGKISISLQKIKKKLKSSSQLEEVLKIKKDINDAMRKHNNLKITEKWKLRKAVNIEGTLSLPKENVQEMEKFIYNEGMCFGERGLIYHKDRKISANAIEDSDLFVLHKDAFDNSISKCIIKAENERKSLIMTSFGFLKDIPSIRFEDIYRRFLLKYCQKDQILYEEGDKQEKIFLIYKGECKLQKKQKKSDETQSVNSKITLIKMSKGDIAGLEAINNSPYKHCLVSSSDYTIVYEIDLDVFMEYPRELKHLSRNLLNQREAFLLESAQNKKDFSKINSSFKKDDNIPTSSNLFTNELDVSDVHKHKHESRNNCVKNMKITFNNEGIKLINDSQTKNNKYIKSLKNMKFKSVLSINELRKLEDKKSIFKLTSTKRNTMSAKMIHDKSMKDKRPLLGYIFDNYLYSKTNFNTRHFKSMSPPHLTNLEGNKNYSRNQRHSINPCESNVVLWKKTINSSHLKYHTGQFYLPLFSLQDK